MDRTDENGVEGCSLGGVVPVAPVDPHPSTFVEPPSGGNVTMLSSFAEAADLLESASAQGALMESERSRTSEFGQIAEQSTEPLEAIRGEENGRDFRFVKETSMDSAVYETLRSLSPAGSYSCSIPTEKPSSLVQATPAEPTSPESGTNSASWCGGSGSGKDDSPVRPNARNQGGSCGGDMSSMESMRRDLRMLIREHRDLRSTLDSWMGRERDRARTQDRILRCVTNCGNHNAMPACIQRSIEERDGTENPPGNAVDRNDLKKVSSCVPMATPTRHVGQDTPEVTPQISESQPSLEANAKQGFKTPPKDSEDEQVVQTLASGRNWPGSLTSGITRWMQKAPKDELVYRPSLTRGMSRSMSRLELGDSKLRRFVRSQQFVGVCSTVVVLNALFIGLETHYRVTSLFDEIEPSTYGVWMQRGFCVLFVVELTLRIAAEKRGFFYGPDCKWNMFDALLVIFAVAELVTDFIRHMGYAAQFNASHVMPARILRLMRVIRVTRVLRLVKIIHSLRMMMMLIVNSLVSLFWACMVLILVMYLFGITFLHGVIGHLEDENSTNIQTTNFSGCDTGVTLTETFAKFYGGVPQTLLSLFMAVTSGVDWIELTVPLLQLHPGYVVLFSFYIAFITLSVMNVVTGVFVDSAYQVAQMDRDVVIQEELHSKEKYMRGLKDIFLEADTDESGTLSWEEFESHLEDQRVKAYLATLELDISEAYGLFKLLNITGDDEVAIDAFVMGCMRLKGPAKSIDVCTLLYENRQLAEQILCLKEYTEDQLHRITVALGLPSQQPKLRITHRRTVSGNLSSGCAPRHEEPDIHEPLQRISCEVPNVRIVQGPSEDRGNTSQSAESLVPGTVHSCQG
mmetsp:Transcript_29669/g.81204  ORF Transcript_29669/g.81204 Transcript_29669/m.81204 type:complete len:856 (-) Transcript_29669:194-2761(-)